MTTPPQLSEEAICRCLFAAYGCAAEQLTRLSLGADADTVVYRVVANDHAEYFLKVRKDNFRPAAVTVPNDLHVHGCSAVIPALRTRSGQLWTQLGPYPAMLYPFVEGRAGLEARMSADHWRQFGDAVHRLHDTVLPQEVAADLPREDFSPRWRRLVVRYLDQLEPDALQEPVVRKAAHYLLHRKDEVRAVFQRTEELALRLQTVSRRYVPCHSDLHGWNLYIDQQEHLYIVDWDGLTLAPRERDLMFIGGGHGESGYTPEAEADLFYAGYGPAEVDPAAIAYYRYERSLLDLVDDCERLFSTAPEVDEQHSLFEDMQNKFKPGGTLERAYAADRPLGE